MLNGLLWMCCLAVLVELDIRWSRGKGEPCRYSFTAVGAVRSGKKQSVSCWTPGAR